MIGSGDLHDGVYISKSIQEGASLATYTQDRNVLWHAKIGHPSNQYLSKLSRYIGFNFDSNKMECCDACHRSKQCMITFPLSASKANKNFDLIHCDLWEKYNTRSHNGSHYFLTIVDDYSRATWVYLLKDKSEIVNHINNFCKMVATQFETKVNVIRSDNGTKFVSTKVHTFLHDEGILHETSCVHTPQQHGRVERKHRHILNVARVLRFDANLPLHFWGECILIAVYLINRTPTVSNEGITPYQLLNGKPPSNENLRVFGCLFYVKTLTKPHDKFAARVSRCIFVGYPRGKKGWRVYNPSTREFYVSREVKFYEHLFPYKQNVEDSIAVIDETTTIFSNSTSPNEVNQSIVVDIIDTAGTDNDLVVQSNSSSPELLHNAVTENAALLPEQGEEDLTEKAPRDRRPPTYLKDYYCHSAVQEPPCITLTQTSSLGKSYPISQYISYDNFSSSYKAFLSTIKSHDEPKNFSQTMQSPEWQEPMAQEITASEENNTWTLAPLPAGKKLVGCKWVYRIKYKANGEIDKYKAHLVAEGYTQIEGEDFIEIFAPVAKMTTVRCLLAIAAVQNWELYQMDVSNVFLHGDLDEEVYMAVPPGYVVHNSQHVYKLQKSLYGLRQASINWYAKLSQALIHYGFKQCSSDHSLFTYASDSTFIATQVYVDDLVLASNDSIAYNKFKQYLSECFKMKDLGKLKYFLGLELSYGNTGLFLCQQKYTFDILKECGMLDCKPCGFPMEQHHGLSAEKGAAYPNPPQYRRLIGRLIYLTITRP